MRRVALVLLVSPLVLAACGGGKSGSPEVKLTPVAYVKGAAKKTGTATGIHMKLKASVTISTQPVVVSGDGDFEQHKGSLHLDFNAGGLAGTIDTLVQGNGLYLKSPLFADALPNGKTWVRLDLAKAAASNGLESLAAQDPATTLTRLASLRNVREIGTEQIGGVDTTHYRGRVTKSIAGETYGPFDVWVGKDDGYVHRVAFSLTTPEKQKLTATLDFSDFGKDVTVSAPSAAETADGSTLQIPGLGG